MHKLFDEMFLPKFYARAQVIETFHKIVEKCCRLTANLSEEAKAIVKKYNDVVTFFMLILKRAQIT